MFKSADITKINPVSRILPVLSVEAIADPIQLLEAESTKLLLRQETPLTLKLSQHSAELVKNSAAFASLSAAATLIDSVLKDAQHDGYAAKFEAKTAITRTPEIPELLAKELKNTITNTGLFYEAHLSEFVEGVRSLANIKQEPQNQINFTANNMLSQQLAILETQRLAWHGEVWPGQKMAWDLYRKDEHASSNCDEHLTTETQNTIASDLTLHLPNLGKVTAKISMLDGRMQIRLLVDEAETLNVLKAQSKDLVDAISKNGQVLDTLMVTAYA